jgi:predicted dehydrogenase
LHRVAIIGCGYVAALYAQTIINHPELEFVGAFDRDAGKADEFSSFFNVPRYDSLSSLLADSGAEIIANLTNPRDHYDVTKACLDAGRHVYSEKPLGMTLNEALNLAQFARSRGLMLASAPCNMLAEAVQTMWRTIHEGTIGRVRLVYAEMDDGMVHLQNYQDWRTINETQWPAKDEFEVGCTYEHAGYHLGILAQLFGPALQLSSYSACLVPEKGDCLGCETVAPDYSVGCIEYASGVRARLTCSIVGPENRSLTVIGDRGRIVLDDVWNYGGSLKIYDTVYIPEPPKRDLVSRVRRRFGWEKKKIILPKTVPLIREANFQKAFRAHPMDFCRGIAEMADALREHRPCRLSADLGVHITELTEALQNPAHGQPARLQTSFKPIEPMPWAGFCPASAG